MKSAIRNAEIIDDIEHAVKQAATRPTNECFQGIPGGDIGTRMGRYLWQVLIKSTEGDGDANDDGFVDDLDLTALATEWPSSGPEASAVPEPAALSLLALLALSLPKRGGSALLHRKPPRGCHR